MSAESEGQRALLEGKYKLSVSLFRQALEGQPESIAAREGLAQSLLRLRAYDQAINEAENVLGRDPQRAVPHVLIAYASYGKKDIRRFKHEAALAYSLDPQNAEVVTCYGAMLLDDRDVDGSLQLLSRAVQLDPGLMVARRNLAIAFRLKGDSKSALRQRQFIFSASPSLTTFADLVSAFHNAHVPAVGLALLALMILTLVLRASLVLLVPTAYVVYILIQSLRLLMVRQWRVGLLGSAYSLFIGAVLYAIYTAVR